MTWAISYQASSKRLAATISADHAANLLDGADCGPQVIMNWTLYIAVLMLILEY